jgi:hypothetical protein
VKTVVCIVVVEGGSEDAENVEVKTLSEDADEGVSLDETKLEKGVDDAGVEETGTEEEVNDASGVDVDAGVEKDEAMEGEEVGGGSLVLLEPDILLLTWVPQYQRPKQRAREVQDDKLPKRLTTK